MREFLISIIIKETFKYLLEHNLRTIKNSIQQLPLEKLIKKIEIKKKKKILQLEFKVL